MTHAYNPIYLTKTSRAVGNMLHCAVYEFGYEGSEFLQLFIQSGIAGQIEDGNPKYIAGKSGLELLCEVIEKTSGEKLDTKTIKVYDRSDSFWVGYVLTYYQCRTKKSFREILEVLPYNELLGLYKTLHEADIHKSYEVFDLHFSKEEPKLKTVRKKVGLTQAELAKAAGVPLSTIRAYERKAKDIGKAQIDTVMRLVGALGCDLGDILE